MPNLPVALQFFLNSRRVAFAAMIEAPNRDAIWVSLGATRDVLLPDGTTRRVGQGWAELVDLGAGESSMLLRGVLIFADAHGDFTNERDDWRAGPKPILPRLTITIQNTPTGGSQQNMTVVAQDASPQYDGDPIVPSEINLFPTS